MSRARLVDFSVVAFCARHASNQRITMSCVIAGLANLAATASASASISNGSASINSPSTTGGR